MPHCPRSARPQATGHSSHSLVMEGGALGAPDDNTTSWGAVPGRQTPRWGTQKVETSPAPANLTFAPQW